MTNQELNEYIKHYIEKDHTGRAVMLTGAWGMGKSFYVKNTLIPFLAKPENGQHQCIVVSLYGLSSLSEVSKAIYFEARMKKFAPKSEVGKAALMTAKTVLKGIAGRAGFDLSSDESALENLYQSIDLTAKLIVFEDVERTDISIFQFLGYVNSLVEQDGVKVLLVTNENEFIQYKPVVNTDEEKNKDTQLTSIHSYQGSKQYTEKTLRYFQTKEKSVGDTIAFVGDLKQAVIQIINSFDSHILKKFATEKCSEDIIAIMVLTNSTNLRSVIYACQKTADIFEYITDENSFSDDFMATIFFGIMSFSLQMHAGYQISWLGVEQYSLEWGNSRYPLFRFCYDYIIAQQFDADSMNKAAEALKKYRLYDRDKTSSDPDIIILNGYYLHTEQEVRQAVSNVCQRLNNPDDISFYDYGYIASSLISIKYDLNIQIENAKKMIVNNLKGLNKYIREEDLFTHVTISNSEDAKIEFSELQKSMIDSLYESDSVIPEFSYLPEQARAFSDYVATHKGDFYSKRCFLKCFDINKLVEMIFKCSPAQMNDIRLAICRIYDITNIREFFFEDEPAICELLNGLERTRERSDVDSVKLLQYRWIVEFLNNIKSRLS